MPQEFFPSRWGQRSMWSCRRGCAASPEPAAPLEYRNGPQTTPGRDGAPIRGQSIQVVVGQSSLRILNYKRLGSVPLLAEGRLVLRCKRNRIARPSSLDEANGEEWPANFWGLTSGPGGRGGCR